MQTSWGWARLLTGKTCLGRLYQETREGGFSQRGFAESIVTPGRQRNNQGYGPSSTFGLRKPQQKEAHTIVGRLGFHLHNFIFRLLICEMISRGFHRKMLGELFCEIPALFSRFPSWWPVVAWQFSYKNGTFARPPFLEILFVRTAHFDPETLS